MKINDTQVLVKVKYSGLNRADLSQKSGTYPAPPGHSDVLGLEIFGVVINIGAKVKRVAIGDQIFALVNGGGYGEECVVEENFAIKKPDYLTKEECAAIPEVFMTSLFNLVEVGKLRKGQTVLIHAGASGVGLAAIQVAKLIGATVITTVRHADKALACHEAGADNVIIQQDVINFAHQLKQLNLEVNLILDPVGGKYINQDLECLLFGGKLINIGLMAGSTSEINLALVLRKNLQIIGSTIRNKPNKLKAKLTSKLEELILPAIKAKKIKVVIDKIFAITDITKAHEYLATNKNTGKVLFKH